MTEEEGNDLPSTPKNSLVNGPEYDFMGEKLTTIMKTARPKTGCTALEVLGNLMSQEGGEG